MKSNIVLIGFMGVGKTPIGQEIAKRLNKNFIDTDREIEESLKMPINKIFAEHGEEYFRQKEKEMIESIALRENCVIATGGGIVLNKSNIEALRQKGNIICLLAQPEVIYERVKKGNHRPLLAGEDMYESITRILSERAQKYQCADYYVDTSTKSIEEATDEIISYLQQITV
ncbi:MAG: shikimate kinase [Firmicutes bacterium HGW-Firmicutes-12]|nr:MAG: shikimate kinase [Firmicutes bacterium HGW-Firmicutes-12]